MSFSLHGVSIIQDLIKEDNIAAIEIHNVLLVEEYRDVFSYDFIKKNIQIVNGISLLSFSDKSKCIDTCLPNK